MHKQKRLRLFDFSCRENMHFSFTLFHREKYSSFFACFFLPEKCAAIFAQAFFTENKCSSFFACFFLPEKCTVIFIHSFSPRKNTVLFCLLFFSRKNVPSFSPKPFFTENKYRSFFAYFFSYKKKSTVRLEA